MRIAMPLADGRLSEHFGHSEKFALVDVDEKGRSISASSEVAAPPHAHGLLPRWLSEHKVELVIAGGMGAMAQSLLVENNIRVVAGVSADFPETIVRKYLEGTLQATPHACVHPEGHVCDGH